MKKIVISVLAVAAIAACTKSEVQYNESSEISFAPFAKMSTKAAVNDTNYPDALNMFVFANAGAANADVPTGFDEPYFANAEFSHGSHSENVFGGVTPYYWPNVKKLIFSGYSKSGNVTSLSPTYVYDQEEGTWEINMEGYQPGKGTATSGDNDLMWFPTTAEAYGKPADADFAVDVVMKHACSWVTIKIKGDATTGANNTTWKIKDLTIADLAQSGDVTLGTTASWNPTPPKAGTSFDVYEETEPKALTTDYVDYTSEITYKDLVVVPQETKTLTVTYQYVSQKGAAADGSEDIVIEEVKEIPLTYTTTEGEGKGNAWKPGYHYTYNITIGTLEILIEPTLDIWETVEEDIVLQ